jgi:hypothetical protein
MKRPLGRGVVALLLIGSMVTGCTQAVEVPREQFESASQAHNVSHRITMTGGSRYAVKRFSLTDSTVTIAELNPADERYKHVELPIVMRREDMKSIERLELDPGKSFFVVLPIGLAIIWIVVLSTSPGITN